MFEISVTRRFHAAHQLRMATGELEPLHAHDWRVTVTIAGPGLDSCGLLVDFGPIRDRLDELLGPLRGQRLDTHPAFIDLNPSAENVALWIAAVLRDAVTGPARLACVEVEEEPGCVARYFIDTPATDASGI